MNWAVKLSITERVVTVAERPMRFSGGKHRPPEGGAEETRGGTMPGQRRRCAVVIDRDPEVVGALSTLLSPELDVHSAFCPLSAALLLDQLDNVDLAFVELELPDLAGEQLLQQLGRWPDAIRVLLSEQPLAQQPRSSSTRFPSALPRNAYLAHLVLSKPISAQVVRALQRATLGLPRI
jgi:CheY-like chemotaxis protein